jgi:cysteine synthase A
MILSRHLDYVGHTPIAQIPVEELPSVHLYAKLEFYNPLGSVKDRAASYILKKLFENHEIDANTIIIESSSGNFGVALAGFCHHYGLQFIAVVDPHISPINEMLIKAFGASVVKVTEPDENGGYLLHRIQRVKALLKEYQNAYWVNQYGNPYNAEAYYATLGEEICEALEEIDYMFLGVSSGGTITGCSRKITERCPQAKIIAVDIVGSVIFGHSPQKRHIPGMGSSMVPAILQEAKIDDVVMIDEISTIEMCHELLQKHYIFAGGSSGSVFAAVKRYFSTHKPVKKPCNVVMLFPDRGERYINTIYNEQWCAEFTENQARMRAL